ncbi:MAG: hypothetical protein ABIP75_05980 [Pyrinomonadaceae bacterium]
MEDEKLAIDEARRLANHEAVKSEVNQEVQAAVQAEAGNIDEGEQAHIAAVGSTLRHKAVADVGKVENEVERSRVAARVSQVIDYLFYLIYGIIGMEIVLELMGARDSSGFKTFIDTLSAPLLAPFKSLLVDPTAGRFQLRLSFVVALVVYLLIHLAINGLLRMMAHRKVSI